MGAAMKKAKEAPVRKSRNPTPMPGNPINMAGIGSDDWTPCPGLGDDNRAVLREWLGYDDARVAALEEAKVLVDKPPE